MNKKRVVPLVLSMAAQHPTLSPPPLLLPRPPLHPLLTQMLLTPLPLLLVLVLVLVLMLALTWPSAWSIWGGVCQR